MTFVSSQRVVRSNGGGVGLASSFSGRARSYRCGLQRSRRSLRQATDLLETPLAAMPKWMLAIAITNPSLGASKPRPATDWAALLTGAAEGERHAVAARITGHLLGKGLLPAEVEQIVLAYAARCRPPFPEDEALRLVKDPVQRDAATAIGSAELWPTPEPLPTGLPSVSPFDSKLLPEALRRWVDDIAERLVADDRLAHLKEMAEHEFRAAEDKARRDNLKKKLREAVDGNTYDRIGRGALHIEAACISVLGGIQPGPLHHYLREVFGQWQDDGLIQRFQLLVYPDTARTWHNVDRGPDSQAKSRAVEIFRRLATFDLMELGAHELSPDELPFLRFTPEAQAVFDSWRATIEAKLRSDARAAAPTSYPTVQEALPAFLDRLVDLGEIRQSTAAAYRNRLAVWAYPLIGDTPWNLLTREQIGAVLLKLRSAKKSRGSSPILAG